MTNQERGRAKEQMILAEMKAETQTERDIIHLKQIELSIMPYSRWWRWGYLSSVRRARRALEREADGQLVGKSDTLRNGGKADGEP